MTDKPTVGEQLVSALTEAADALERNDFSKLKVTRMTTDDPKVLVGLIRAQDERLSRTPGHLAAAADLIERQAREVEALNLLAGDWKAAALALILPGGGRFATLLKVLSLGDTRLLSEQLREADSPDHVRIARRVAAECGIELPEEKTDG